MQQHELRPPSGAKKQRKRLGRGNASGHGTYAGKGLKGQQARSGYKTRPAFEGGQTALVRRLPRRRGFRNPFRIEFTPVNLRDLARVADSEITPEALHAAGLVRSLRQPIKLLGDGELSTALKVRVHRVSASARAKIEAAGGSVEEMTPVKPPEERRRKRKIKVKPQPSAEAQTEDGDESPGDESPKAETEETSEDEEQDDSGSEE